MQALSTTGGGDDYSPHLRELFQARVAGWLADCLAVTPPDSDVIAGIVLMAFDGFAMNVHLEHGMGQPFGLAEISVLPAVAERLGEELAARGWRLHG